jgi:hypothetical protein
MARRLASYQEFWPFYVSQHMHPVTRGLHFTGTALVLGTVAAAVLASPAWLLVAPVAGYGPAWIAHFFVERNKPATFTYPLWSLRGDLRMFGLMLLGRMRPEIERAARLYPTTSGRA